MSGKLKAFLCFIQFALILDVISAQCNTCGSSGIACTSQTDYAICINGVQSNDIVATCPTYAYCDLNAVCANKTATSTPSCAPAQPPTGTTLDPWTSWCRSNGKAGRFAYTSDTTCQAYIYCFVNANLLYGNYYKCVGTSVFNPNLQSCVAPANYACPP